MSNELEIIFVFLAMKFDSFILTYVLTFLIFLFYKQKREQEKKKD